MNKWLKRILITIASLVVLVVVAVLALPFVVDPSAFRAPLERLAQRQGVVLRLEGPIDWQFYPRLGLSLEGFYLAPQEQPDEPLARAESATAAVALMPLFSGEILVDELVLHSPAINLLVDEQGRGNWELLQSGEQGPAPAEAEQQTAGEGLQLAVERISINDGVLAYRDLQSGQTAEVSELSVQLSDVNLEERAFPLMVEGLVRSSELPRPMRLQLESQLRTNSALTEFALEGGDLSLSAEGQANAQIAAQLSGEVTLEPTLKYQGQLTIASFSPRAVLSTLGQDLPAMADPDALTALALELELTGSDTQVRSEKLAITLDETTLTGSFGLELPEGGTPKINLALQGNTIVLDRYLPPTEEEGGETVADAPPAAPAAAEAAPEPLPLEALRSINLDAVVSMDQIVAMEMAVGKPRIAITANNGLWRMTELQGNFYQGQINGDAQLDARQGETASMQVGLRLDSMAVQPLLVDFAEFSDLSGTVTGELKAQTRAATTTELMDNLSAAFVFTSPGLVFQGVNAEYYYCQAATQLDDDSEMPQREWPPRTEITQVEGQFLFDDGRLSIASFAAYVENLVLTATGFLDLDEMIYRVRVPMRLAQQQTSAAGCLIESKFLQNRAVDVLGCAGSLAEPEFGKQCGLDKDAVATLAKQAIRYNVDKRVDEEKEDIREKLKKRVQEELGEDEDDPARQLLRDLFKR
ncbi:AsmA family protein [Proteobacteria bacterium 005FR1]|nr:AsmA family protein [Proteobacteria bacterium 005FR1]